MGRNDDESSAGCVEHEVALATSSDVTRTRSRTAAQRAVLRVPVATILWHPDAERVGEQAILSALVLNGETTLNRDEPRFNVAGAEPSRPLGDTSVSRNAPLRLRHVEGGLVLDGSKPGKVSVDGRALIGEQMISDAALDAGVVIGLSHAVALVLRVVSPQPRQAEDMGLVGPSEALAQVRRRIRSVAARDIGVLIRGESGTGKELVARALHDHGERRRGPFVAVSMADIAHHLAASELFGHVKGAFTGANADAPGRFGAAHGGTLFLDEIGLAPLELQAALLRVLETRTAQAVGATRPRSLDVRVVAATDADLELAVARGRFLAPLLYRLQSYEIVLPPLRARREDIGAILRHFLQIELHREGREALLATGDREPWLAASLVADLALRDLAGNARDLRRVAQRLAIDHGAETEVRLDSVTSLLGAPRAAPGSAQLDGPPAQLDGAVPGANSPLPAAMADDALQRNPTDLTTTELEAALDRANQSPDRAAKALRISRTTLYKLMRGRGLTIASQLTTAEIRPQLEAHAGNLAAAARALRVSERALLARLRALGDAELNALLRAGR